MPGAHAGESRKKFTEGVDSITGVSYDPSPAALRKKPASTEEAGKQSSKQDWRFCSSLRELNAPLEQQQQSEVANGAKSAPDVDKGSSLL